MSVFNRNNNKKRKSTTGFSELNRRTYEASQTGRATSQRSSQNNTSGIPRSSRQQPYRQDVSRYSRNNQQQRYANARKANVKKSRRKKVLLIVGCIIAAIAAGIAIFFGIISCNMNSGMGNIGLTPTSLDKPFYMVLMGVDASEERKSNGGTDEDYRSDSIILARIAADEKQVTLMSFHRDIEIDMGEYGTQKLNAAHSLGGPELVIKTVSKLAGVSINHYAEINFDGFKAAVNDLGGVDVDVAMEIDDPQAGGYVAAGQQHLNGEQALILCRARHAFDAFGDGDKYRAANQRLILSAIAQKALSADILTIAQTATDLSKYIKTDLALNDMIGLAQLMKDLNPATDIYSAMTPTEGIYVNDTWYEVLDEDEFKVMMQRMDMGLPPDEKGYIDPATGTIMSTSGVVAVTSNGVVSVTIRNGTNRDGLASAASNKLYALGYSTDVGNANSQDYSRTIIVVSSSDYWSDAETIRDTLGCGQIVENNDEYLFTTEILVIVGEDFSQ